MNKPPKLKHDIPDATKSKRRHDPRSLASIASLPHTDAAQLPCPTNPPHSLTPPSPLPLPNPTPPTHPQTPQTPRKPPPSLTSQRIHHQRPILQLSLSPPPSVDQPPHPMHKLVYCSTSSTISPSPPCSTCSSPPC
ncbi:hypothetical protein M758_2G173200 [Ceratodon purpureus]|nr:hypothetical protein M758_2G173200 [Ceratodon purpureus]